MITPPGVQLFEIGRKDVRPNTGDYRNKSKIKTQSGAKWTKPTVSARTFSYIYPANSGRQINVQDARCFVASHSPRGISCGEPSQWPINRWKAEHLSIAIVKVLWIAHNAQRNHLTRHIQAHNSNLVCQSNGYGRREPSPTDFSHSPLRQLAGWLIKHNQVNWIARHAPHLHATRA